MVKMFGLSINQVPVGQDELLANMIRAAPVTEKALLDRLQFQMTQGGDDDDDDDGDEIASDGAEDDVSPVAAVVPQKINDDLLARAIKKAISPVSLATYESHRRSLISRGFEYTVVGFVEFLQDTSPTSLAVCNRTIDYWLSSFKMLLFAEQRQILSEVEELLLQKLLMARRRDYPDCRRVTGAMNMARTDKFIEWIRARKEKGDEHISLTAEERQTCEDVATTLYGGALRVFQLRTLQTSSFQWRTNQNGGKELWLTVISKGGEARAATFDKKKVPSMESKPLHPVFQQRVYEIIKRRGRDVRLFDAFSDTLKAKFSACLQFCCKEQGWPASHRYSGTHCFRHGAAQDAYIEGGLPLTMIRTGHLSQAACAMYAMSDEERSALIRKGEDARRVANERVQAARKAAVEYGGLERPTRLSIFGPPRVTADILIPRPATAASATELHTTRRPLSVAVRTVMARCVEVSDIFRNGIAKAQAEQEKALAAASAARRLALEGRPMISTATARQGQSLVWHQTSAPTASAAASRGELGYRVPAAMLEYSNTFRAAMARAQAQQEAAMAAAAVKRMSPQIRPRS